MKGRMRQWIWRKIINGLYGAVVRDLRGAKYGIVVDGFYDPIMDQIVLYFHDDPRSVGVGD